MPTFIGQNIPIMKSLEADLTKKFVGQEVTERFLDEVNVYVIEWIAKKFPLRGIAQYLEGIRFVVEE